MNSRSIGHSPQPALGAAGVVLLVTLLTLGQTGGAPKDARATLDTPLPRPGMGWTTYNFFGPRHDDRLMKEMGKAFVDSGLRDAGYTILRIDGGWWGDDGNRREWYWTKDGKYQGGLPYKAGDPHVDPKNYPGGIRPLADHLHKQGLRLGFYLSPALSMGKADNYPGNKDVKVTPPVTGLALVEQHARWVADNGIDHLFYDGYDWSRNQGTEPYSRMFGWLRREAKRVDRPIVFSVNTGWLGREREWADEWRTSQDINGQWKTILECIASVADPKPGGHGHWNNPDYVMVGFLPDAEAKSQMSLWCVAGAPLYLSHDFRALNAWDRYVLLNTEAIAVDQDAAATQGRRLRQQGAAQVWEKRLSDGSRAVLLLNAGEQSVNVGVSWQELGLGDGPVQVRDLWAHKNLGAFDKGYSAELPARDCAFLLVHPGREPASEPKATWAPHPGKRPDFKPLPNAGWSYRTTMPRRDDPLKNLFDGDPKTGWWSDAAPGQFLEIDFGAPVAFNRLVIDTKGVGPNPWPYKIHAHLSRFALEASAEGKKFTQLTEADLGPNYTIAEFKRTRARYLRIVVRELERTSAYDGGPTFGAKDLFLFDAR